MDEAIARMVAVYDQGHRVVVSFSAGKDSGACLEVCLIAAAETGRLPVEVCMRDEEIMLPGTFEYAERVAGREDVDFTWIIANQPVINIFNRVSPYFWVFDPLLDPSEWVRKPPDWATYIPERHIQGMINLDRYPPPEGRDLFAVIGLRVEESKSRLYGLYSSRGYLTKENEYGVRGCRPIYDWVLGDVWKAHKDFGWDYNSAYDTMLRLGQPPHMLRIAPPTMTARGAKELELAARGWPQWFDRVCERLPGVRQAALYGDRAVLPERRYGETWEECYQRECIDNAPAEWIRERAERYRTKLLRTHHRHSTTPFPEVRACTVCGSGVRASWRNMTTSMFSGDPFGLKSGFEPIEPEFFREGAGKWDGKPTW